MAKRFKYALSAFLTIAALLLVAGAVCIAMPGERAEAVATVVSTLPKELENLFTDYTRTSLSAEYASEEALGALRAEYSGNAECENAISRAEKVLRGEIKYDPVREFSTEDGALNRIEQAGDVAKYSDEVLKWNYCSSDLQITGIYGIYPKEITVYVKAESDAYLPSIIATHNHGDAYGYRSEIRLMRGANTFSFPYFGNDSCGPIYIKNPYTEEGQRGEVSIYIEGGDFYPVYKKGGGETAFLGFLGEYETKRNSDASVPDLAELSTDFAFFTTTSSSLYDTYIRYKTIGPEENLKLWGDFFTRVYEYNGIPTSAASEYGGRYDPKNRCVRLNFRYMLKQGNSGAYAYFYHIGFYVEHYWFANFNNCKNPVGGIHTTDDYSIYAMGHEIGHMLDVDGRTKNETTNNMNATFVYLKIMGKSANREYQPYERTFTRLARDSEIDFQAYDDGRILYKDDNYDHNYMIWWYLESCFPDYWGKLNNMYRYDGRPYPGDKSERMVYYSSLVTGADLGAYFERWGFYFDSKYRPFTVGGASGQYKQLMAEAEASGDIKSRFDRFYYADDAEYAYIRSHGEKTPYKGQTPQITVKKSDGVRTVNISGAQDPSFLGYEVRVSTDGASYTVAGFTRSVQFTDDYSGYNAEPTYKVVGVNRYFNISDESLPAKAGEAQKTEGVCKVGGTVYATLAEGVKNVPDGGTIYLTADCSLGGASSYRAITFAVAEEAESDIRLTVSDSSYMLMQNAAIAFSGRQNAHIIIDGGSVPRIYPPIYAGSGKFTAEYVDFVNHSSNMGGGAFLVVNSDLVLRHCTFENCSGKEAAVLSLTGRTVTLDDCAFRNGTTDIALKSGATLVFENNVSPVSLSADKNSTVRVENFTPSDSDLLKIYAEGKRAVLAADGTVVFEEETYTLTFYAGNGQYSIRTGAVYVFGNENINLKDKYIEEYRRRGTDEIYRAGDKIELSGNAEFDCSVKDNAAVVLVYMDGPQTLSVRGDGRVYLPRTDGGRKIARWTKRGGGTYPAGGSAPASAGVLIPVYEGYFRYDFIVRGEYTGGGFARYGDFVEMPENDGTGFNGWILNGAPVGRSVKICGDSIFTAAFEGETGLYDLSRAEVRFAEEKIIYDGSPKLPEFTVTVNGQTVPCEYYGQVFSNNVNAGCGLVTITGKGLAYGVLEVSFEISPRALTDSDVSVEFKGQNVYTGSEIKLVPTVFYNGAELGRESFSAAYSDCVNAGTVFVTLTFSGNYSGGALSSYQILKAERPEPPASVNAGNAKTLSDIALPENWQWENGALPVEGEKEMLARAVYVGADASNYKNTVAEVAVLLPEEQTVPGNPDPQNPEPGNPDPQNPEPENPAPDKGGFSRLWYLAVPAGAAVAAILAFAIIKIRKRR